MHWLLTRVYLVTHSRIKARISTWRRCPFPFFWCSVYLTLPRYDSHSENYLSALPISSSFSMKGQWHHCSKLLLTLDSSDRKAYSIDNHPSSWGQLSTTGGLYLDQELSYPVNYHDLLRNKEFFGSPVEPEVTHWSIRQHLNQSCWSIFPQFFSVWT